jgi:hypothetical protein
MSLQVNLSLALSALLTKAASLGSNTSSAQSDGKIVTAITDGSGEGQANKIYAATRTLNAVTSESLDLSGVLTDEFGTVLSFTRIVVMYIQLKTAGSTLLVGGAAANGFINWVADATDKIRIRSGTAGKGHLLLWADDATGYVVTPATGDLLKIDNPGAGQIQYDIILVGS